MDACTRTRRRRRPQALPRRKTVRWSSTEVDGLLEGVREHGVGKWAAILRSSGSFNSVRTSVDLKDKWRNLASNIRALALRDAEQKQEENTPRRPRPSPSRPRVSPPISSAPSLSQRSMTTASTEAHHFVPPPPPHFPTSIVLPPQQPAAPSQHQHQQQQLLKSEPLTIPPQTSQPHYTTSVTAATAGVAGHYGAGSLPSKLEPGDHTLLSQRPVIPPLLSAASSLPPPVALDAVAITSSSLPHAHAHHQQETTPVDVRELANHGSPDFFFGSDFAMKTAAHNMDGHVTGIHTDSNTADRLIHDSGHSDLNFDDSVITAQLHAHHEPFQVTELE